MKNFNIKRILVSFLVIALLFANVSFAEDEVPEFQLQENLAIEFLTKSAENEWLSKENDISEYLNVDTEGGLFAQTRINVLKKFRQLNNGMVDDFVSEYNIEYSGQKEFSIMVRLIENLSFVKDGRYQHYNNTYIVSFDENNKIIDVNKVNDWFETEYRYSGKSENIIFSELTKEIINNMQPDVTGLKDVDLFSSADMTSNVQYIMYDPSNAANYALTYSGATSDYYNNNFQSWAGDGGDCMNFASQSMYAGFGGSNEDFLTASESEETMIPLFKNYTIKDNYSTWHLNGGPWLGVNSFYEYISNPTPKIAGLVASVWEIKADQWDLEIDPNLLKGSIILTPGESSTEDQIYGHAIVVTDAEGSTRDLIHYSGHTTNKHDDLLVNRYRNTSLYVVRPIYFKLVHDCLFDGHFFHSLSGMIGGESSQCIWCGFDRLQIVNKLISPTLIGSSKTLTSKASMNVFKMSIQITSPSGEVTWLRDEYNTNFIKRPFTFTEPGLYKITTYAQDTNDILTLSSIETSSTYYVRVTDGSDPNNDDGSVIDTNYVDTQFEIDFIPNMNLD